MKTLQLLTLTLILFSSCKKDEPEVLVAQQDPIEVTTSEKKVLVEIFTNVTCGACPRAHHAIEELEKSNEDVIHITHYLRGPMNHEYSEYVRANVKSIPFTPHAVIQRREYENEVMYFAPEDYHENAELELDVAVQMTLNVDAALNGGKLTLDIAAESQNGFEVDEIEVSVILVEKSVVGDDYDYHQRNYGNEDPNHPYFEQGEYIIGFEHTNVPRKSITPNEGKRVAVENKKATLSLEDDLSEISTEKFAVIVFTSPVGSNEIINAEYLDLVDL